MSQWNAVKKIWAMACDISKQRGGSKIRYFIDGISCGYRHGASPENYKVLRFYEKNTRERATYLTSGRSVKADRELNRTMTPEDNKIMARKSLFYKKYEGLIKRKWCYVPECSFSQMAAFLEGKEVVICKPDRGIMGHGIEKKKVGEIEDLEAFYRKGQQENLLLEECIIQHDSLEKISPGCVSTIRINAARDGKGEICLVGACLKGGRAGAVADNFHSGGVAYPVGLESGRILGPGRNNTEIKDYTLHPGSEVTMPGLEIPHWNHILETVQLAMERMPHVGYVGWDIAVTPDGCELVEGNCHWPGGNIIQLDNVGKYPILEACMRFGSDKETK